MTTLRFSSLLLCFLVLSFKAIALPDLENSPDQKRIHLTMRMVGHEVLTVVGDDTSRVLPIEQNGHVYKIPFESSFGLDPDTLVSLIDTIMTRSGFSDHYLVETQHCASGEIVHSFEVGPAIDLLPCKGRKLPSDCYSILITLMDEHTKEEIIAEASPESKSSSLLLILPFFFVLGLIGYYVRRNHSLALDSDTVVLGQSRFDKKNMVLLLNDKEVDLSNKESELLSTLHQYANAPVEREILLKKVWGDEGDYVGRTLDVFISKLRKKLEGDPTVRIVNIRGIGYKLVLDV